MRKVVNSEVGRFERLLGVAGARSEIDRHASVAQNIGVNGWVQCGSRLAFQAGLGIREQKNILLQMAVISASSLLLAALIERPLIILMAPGILAVQYARLRKMASVRAESFEKDYTALLLSLASAVRTGLDPLVALIESRRLFRTESEVHRELSRLEEMISTGMQEEEAILSFASSISQPDIQLFRQAFILARKEGSSLAGCLQRLARVTRQRQSFRRKIRSAVALQKLSAIGIALCTVVIALIQWSGNSSALVEAINHPVGFKLLVAGTFLIAGGLVWMMSLAGREI